MNVQAVLEELDHWHEMVAPSISLSGYLKLYRGLVREEWKEFQEAETTGNIVKEACDIIVVCRPMITKGTGHDMKIHHAMSNAVQSVLHEMDVNWWQALHKVNQSNLSKLIINSEVDQASDHFARLGIDVRIETLDGVYFGAYSTHDQVVNGKTYAKDKLLKPQSYFEVDESTEWWL